MYRLGPVVSWGKIAICEIGVGTETDPFLWSMPCSLKGGRGMDPGYPNGPRSPWSPWYPAPRHPPALTALWQWFSFIFSKSLFTLVFHRIGNREHICNLPSLFQVAVMKIENARQSRESLRKMQSEKCHQAWGTGRQEHHGIHLNKRKVCKWHHSM